MSPVDSGFPRDSGVKKRMLPSVTDVVRELAKVVSADPAVLFKSARSVVAEELAKVKQGFEAAPLDVLVKRARLQLERDGEATPVSDAPPPMPVFPARPSGASMKRPAPDEPFQDVASRAELNWEKEIPIQPEDAPFRSAILPIPSRSRGPLEISQPIDAPAKAAPKPQPPPTPAQPELDWDLVPQAKPEPPMKPQPPTPLIPEPPAVKAKPAPAEFMPAASEPPAPKPRPTPLEPAPAAFEPPTPKQEAVLPDPASAAFETPAAKPRPTPPERRAPEKPMPRPAVVSAPAEPLVNPREAEIPDAAFRQASPTPSSPRPPFEPPQPAAGPERFLRAPTSPVRHEPAVESMAEIPPLEGTLEDDNNTQPAMEEFRFKAEEHPPPAPARSGRAGWIAALLGVVAIGAGLTWAVREGIFKSDILRSASPAAKKPDVAPAASAMPAPVPTAPPPVLGKPIAPPPKAATAPAKQPAAGALSGAAVPRGRAAVLLTPDWAGKPVVYVIHFSSTKDRESAAKEAQKLGAALGAPAHAVEVDLGEKGIWYRVVIGEFKDVDSARAFRADLEAKKTPGMGFVYEMRGR